MRRNARTIKRRGNFLGWTSLALGLTEIIAAKKLDRFLGTGRGENAGVFQVLGTREVMHGFDLLAHRDKRRGILARVAGDVLDGTLLSAAAKRTRSPSRVLLAGALVLPIIALDILNAGLERRQQRDPPVDHNY